MCTEREEGVAGVRSLRKSGNYDAAVAKLPQLRHEDFHNNEEKLKKLVLQGLAIREVDKEQELIMCVIAAERAKGTIRDQSTKSNATGTDARRTRSSEVLYGHTIVERPGYKLVDNEAGQILVSGIQHDLDKSPLETRCLKSLIARPDTLQTTDDCLGMHADIGKDDVHPDSGFPFLHIIRSSLMCGMGITLNFSMCLVDYVYNEEKGEWVQRTSAPIVTCKIPFSSGFASYVMDAKTSGRHPVGAMYCKKDGKMKLVVLHHGSTYSSREEDALRTRSILLRDVVCSSEETQPTI